MAFADLEELLTGRALDIPKERLDLQGWVAAFRTYKDASPNDRRAMELSLAQAILRFDDWAFIADAIHLARSLRMATLLICAAVRDAERVAPKQYQDVISTEAGRYMRDVPQPQTALSDVQDWEAPSTADDWKSGKVYLPTRFGLDSNESLLGEVPRQAAAVTA